MAERKNEMYYLITFREPTDGKIRTLKARSIQDSVLGLGFVCISDFVWQSTTVVVNPDEEALAKTLENVRSLHLSIYTILSVREIGPKKKGLKFKRDKSNLLVFPERPPDGK